MKQDTRYLIAFTLLLIGFLLILGTLGEYEVAGFIAPSAFQGRTGIGIALMAAAFPVSGDVDELLELLKEKKNRR